MEEKEAKAKPNLRRPRQFQVRLNDRELVKLRKLAEKADLPMVEYTRCKMFDIPFENVGGLSVKRRVEKGKPAPYPEDDAETTEPAEATEATLSTP